MPAPLSPWNPRGAPRSAAEGLTPHPRKRRLRALLNDGASRRFARPPNRPPRKRNLPNGGGRSIPLAGGGTNGRSPAPHLRCAAGAGVARERRGGTGGWGGSTLLAPLPALGFP